MKRWIIFGGVLFVALSGCSFLQTNGPRTETSASVESPSVFYWVKGVPSHLPSLVCQMGSTSTVKTLLGIRYQHESHRLMILSRCEGHTLVLDGLLPIGVSLFSLRYDGRKIQTQWHTKVPSALKVEQILADYLLANASTNLWQGHLPQGMLVRDDGDERVVTWEGKRVVRVQYSLKDHERRPVRLINEAFGYALSMKAL